MIRVDAAWFAVEPLDISTRRSHVNPFYARDGFEIAQRQICWRLIRTTDA